MAAGHLIYNQFETDLDQLDVSKHDLHLIYT
jgi:hypothetical protein